MKKFFKKNWVGVVLGITILTSFFLMFFSAKTDSLTVDEKVHISAGYLHVWEGDYSFNSEHPPLLDDLEGFFAKAAHPDLPKVPIKNYEPFDSGQWSFATDFFYRAGNDAEKITMWARLPVILLMLALIYLVFVWAKTLFGAKAGLVAAALTAFCPNLLAHGRLATTDIGLVFFFLLALWLLRKWLIAPSWKNIILFAFALAGAILGKFSSVLIFPIILVAVILFIPRKRIVELIGQLLVGLVLAGILCWGVYLFSMRQELLAPGSFTSASGLIFGPVAKWFLAPIWKYVYGYRLVADHNSIGHWSFFNGSIGYQGWWTYFLEVLGLKVPLAVFGLLALSVVFFRKVAARFFDEFFIIFPLIFFLGVSLTSKIDIGIRHVLLVLPLLYIFISRLGAVKNRVVQIITAVLVAAQIGTAILAYPNYISYFNPIAGGPVKASSYVADSNIDWDQNMIRFATWARQAGVKKVYELCWNYDAFLYYGIEPVLLPEKPPKGWVVICIQQIRVRPEGFSLEWATKYPPDKIIGDAMYVWDFNKTRD